MAKTKEERPDLKLAEEIIKKFEGKPYYYAKAILESVTNTLYQRSIISTPAAIKRLQKDK